MQNLAVMFSFHKFHSFDPFPMNGKAMNQGRRHCCCTYVQQQQQRFCNFEIYFQIES
jgi:hypothetical protein